MDKHLLELLATLPDLLKQAEAKEEPSLQMRAGEDECEEGEPATKDADEAHQKAIVLILSGKPKADDDDEEAEELDHG